MKNVRFLKEIKFSEPPSLLVGWEKDVGSLATGVINFLNEKLKTFYFCEIKPVEFFSIDEVSVKNGVIVFPQSKFYAAPEKGLIIFKSSTPIRKWWDFLNLILDIVEKLQVKELFTINGNPWPVLHNQLRRVLTVRNDPKFKNELKRYGLLGMEYEGPPAISSYLLWVAKERKIPGLSLWIDICFYLSSFEDVRAQKRILQFLDQRFNLEINFEEIDEKIKKQDLELRHLRSQNPEIDSIFELMEKGHPINPIDQEKLIRAVFEHFSLLQKI
ncbi:MAG: PAC2 family protein [Thermodesulfovibrio sp.]|nr:PAC2 family protein [Thermodesulfovibrio sp.]